MGKTDHIVVEGKGRSKDFKGIVRGAGHDASDSATLSKEDLGRRAPDAVAGPEAQNNQAGASGAPSKGNWGGRVKRLFPQGASFEKAGAISLTLRGKGYCHAKDFGFCDEPKEQPLQRNALATKKSLAASRELLAFVHSLSKFTKIDELVVEATRQSMAFMGCQAGSFYLWKAAQNQLLLKAAFGPESEKRQGQIQKLGEGLAGWVAESKEPLLVFDARKVPRIQDRTCTRYEDKSCIVCPVQNGPFFYGVLCFTMRTGGAPFNAQDLRLAQALSDILASALNQFRSIQGITRAQLGLAECGQASGSSIAAHGQDLDVMHIGGAGLLDSAPMGIVIYDHEMNVRLANAGAQMLLGAADKAMKIHDILANMADADTSDLEAKLRGGVEQADRFQLRRIPFRTSNGSALLDIIGVPIGGSENRPVGCMLSFRDVSAEAELEKRLLAAEHLASMGKITAEVAHELNNPLDGIIRFQTLAARLLHADTEGAKACLEESRKGLIRLSNILGDLLNLARSPFSDGESPASISDMIHAAVRQYEGKAEQAQIKVLLDVPSDLPAFPKDGLCGVFGNVIKNGLEAMVDGGELAFAAWKGDGFVRVRISDTGPGIPEDLASKVFAPFFTTKKACGGSGLGLSWCRDFLRAMGGDITLSQSNSGAVFDISVPIAPKGS